jgi:Uma2 family endonuclease
VPARLSSRRYLALVHRGVLEPDDRVELLEGVIVAMPPHNVAHAAGVRRVSSVLYRAVGEKAVVQVQLALRAGRYSVPEPDVAVLPGTLSDYDHQHPAGALVVVEVADSSLPQDRITKAAIYAAAGIPEYWIVNVRDQRVEWFRDPRPSSRRYATVGVAGRGRRVVVAALPGVAVEVDALLPARRR